MTQDDLDDSRKVAINLLRHTNETLNKSVRPDVASSTAPSDSCHVLPADPYPEYFYVCSLTHGAPRQAMG